MEVEAVNNDQQLTLEQELKQRLFADQVQRMSHEQAQQVLVQLHEEMMIRENLYREILKDAWGIEEEDWLSDSLFPAG